MPKMDHGRISTETFPSITEDGKRTKRVSMSTTFREKFPENQRMASMGNKFSFNHTTQMDIVPRGWGDRSGTTRTTNATGRAANALPFDKE